MGRPVGSLVHTSGGAKPTNENWPLAQDKKVIWLIVMYGQQLKTNVIACSKKIFRDTIDSN